MWPPKLERPPRPCRCSSSYLYLRSLCVRCEPFQVPVCFCLRQHVKHTLSTALDRSLTRLDSTRRPPTCARYMYLLSTLPSALSPLPSPLSITTITDRPLQPQKASPRERHDVSESSATRIRLGLPARLPDDARTCDGQRLGSSTRGHVSQYGR